MRRLSNTLEIFIIISIVIVLSIFISVTGSSDVCLIKTDASGNEEWSRTFGGGGPDQGMEVEQTRDGGYIIAGSYTSPYSYKYYEVLLIKTDSRGNVYQ